MSVSFVSLLVGPQLDGQEDPVSDSREPGEIPRRPSFGIAHECCGDGITLMTQIIGLQCRNSVSLVFTVFVPSRCRRAAPREPALHLGE